MKFRLFLLCPKIIEFTFIYFFSFFLIRYSLQSFGLKHIQVFNMRYLGNVLAVHARAYKHAHDKKPTVKQLFAMPSVQQAVFELRSDREAMAFEPVTVAISFSHQTKGSTGRATAESLQAECFRVLGLDYTSVALQTISDFAARSAGRNIQRPKALSSESDFENPFESLIDIPPAAGSKLYNIDGLDVVVEADVAPVATSSGGTSSSSSSSSTTTQTKGEALRTYVARLAQVRWENAAVVQEINPCDLHANAKIAAWACGYGTRSRGGEPFDPFDEGAELLKKCNEIAKYFHYGKKGELQRLLKAAGSRVLTPHTAICGTRIQARENL